MTVRRTPSSGMAALPPILGPIVAQPAAGSAISYLWGAYPGLGAASHAWLLAGVPVADGYVPVTADIGKVLTVNETVGAITLTNSGTVRTASAFLGGRFKTGDSAYAANPAAGTGVAQGGTFYLLNNTGQTLNGFRIGWNYNKSSNATVNAIRETLIGSGGSGYTTATVAISGGSGSGADIRAIVSGGAVTALYVRASGSGWLPGETPVLTISGDGTGATATVTRMDGAGEAAYRYDAVLSGGIEYPLGTTTAATIGGSATGTIAHGGAVETDVLTLGTAVPAGAIYGVKALETIAIAPTFSVVKSGSAVASVTIGASGSGLWETQYSLGMATGSPTTTAVANAYTYQGRVVYTEVVSGGAYTGTPVPTLNVPINRALPVGPLTSDRGATGSVLSTATVASGPEYVAAAPTTPVRSQVHVGDSIANGSSGGDTLGDHLGSYGWPQRVVARAGVGVLKETLPGDYVSTFVLAHAARSAMAGRAAASSALVQLGTNDISRGDSLATIQANMIAAWRILRASTPVVRQSTITPNVSTSDNYATIAGQTPQANRGPGSIQAALNDWLRDGAPLLNGTPAPTGSSATGTLRAGATGHPLSAVWDAAGMVEPTVNAGVWIPIAWPGFYVAGSISAGIHPNDVIHAQIRGRVGTIVSTPGSGYTSAPAVTWSNLGIPLAMAVMSGTNTLSSITAVSDGGVDYDFPPPITILALNGAGSGATAKAVMTGKRITSYTVTAAGTGYTNGALVSIGGALPPVAHAVLNGDGTVTTVLDWPGSDLFQAPTLTLSGGGGSGAGATATLKRLVDPAGI